MTTVRIAHAEPRPGNLGNGGFITHGHQVVLADDAGRRAVSIWLRGEPGESDLAHLIELAGRPAGQRVTAGAPEEVTVRLLRAAGAGVTGVDLDELGPEVTAARIALTGPAETRHVTARLAEGLAIALTAGAPVRVSDAVMDRLAVPLPADDRPVPLPEPGPALAVLRLGRRPRYEPRNLAFADGLDSWQLGGSFTDHASHSHWRDYACAAEDGIAALSSTVPQPAGFAFLGQEIYADDYRGAVVTFRGEFRTQDTAGSAGLFLRIHTDPRDLRRPFTEQTASDDPGNNIVTITGRRDWTSHEVTARVPGDANIVMFGIFLAGRGRIELRHAEVTCSA